MKHAVFEHAAFRCTVALFLIVATWTLYPIATVTTPLVSAESLSSTVGSTLTTAGRTPLGSNEAVTGGATIKSTEKCAPVSNTTPAPLELTNMPATLEKQIDAPTRYRIYGNDSSDVRSQISACGPVSSGANKVEYAAVTQYQLTWQYQYESDGTKCKITEASVGIHVSQTLPQWQPADSTKKAFAEKWAAFDAALAEHEDGHTAIDVAYAQKLLKDLNQMPPVACDQLKQSVKQLTDSVVSELEQANEVYDSQTNHGATQGAILP